MPKPQIYKVGINWILWVPGVRVYRFASWKSAVDFALDPVSRQPVKVAAALAAVGS